MRLVLAFLPKLKYGQLQDYMDKLSLTKGYLLTFDFRKNKKQHQEWVKVEGRKNIFDVMV